MGAAKSKTDYLLHYPHYESRKSQTLQNIRDALQNENDILTMFHMQYPACEQLYVDKDTIANHIRVEPIENYSLSPWSIYIDFEPIRYDGLPGGLIFAFSPTSAMLNGDAIKEEYVKLLDTLLKGIPDNGGVLYAKMERLNGNIQSQRIFDALEVYFRPGDRVTTGVDNFYTFGRYRVNRVAPGDANFNYQPQFKF